MPLTPAQQAFFDDLQASFTGFKEALKFALRWDNDRVGTSLVEASGRHTVLQAAYADLAPRLGLNPALALPLAGLARTDVTSPDVNLNTSDVEGHIPRV